MEFHRRSPLQEVAERRSGSGSTKTRNKRPELPAQEVTTRDGENNWGGRGRVGQFPIPRLSRAWQRRLAKNPWLSLFKPTNQAIFNALHSCRPFGNL